MSHVAGTPVHLLRSANAAYKLINNAVCCVYKPARMPLAELVHDLKVKLVAGLNSLPLTDANDEPIGNADWSMDPSLPLTNHQLSLASTSAKVICDVIKEDPETGVAMLHKRQLMRDYRTHERVIGPRWLYDDIVVQSVTGPVHDRTSGLCVLTFNEATETMTKQLRDARFLTEFYVSGVLGTKTTDFWSESPAMESNVSYSHLNTVKMGILCDRLVENYRKAALDYSGVDKSSQAAADMAGSGYLRPSELSAPLFVGLRVVTNQRRFPHFSLLANCANADELYMVNFINDFARMLDTVAATTKLQRLRYGPFTCAHALLHKQFHIECIVNNMVLCGNLLSDMDANLKTPPKTFAKYELIDCAAPLPAEYTDLLARCDQDEESGGLLPMSAPDHRFMLTEKSKNARA